MTITPYQIATSKFSTMVMAVAFSLLASFFSGISSVSASYNCFTPNHCYSLNQWNGFMVGGYTHATLVPEVVRIAPGRISSEMWIIDTCGNCQWVEAGYNYVADSNLSPPPCHNIVTYFYAIETPAGTFFDDCLGSIPQADFDRGDIGVEIWSDSAYDFWAINWLTASGTLAVGIHNRFVHYPFYQQVGMEISGTDGAEGSLTWFGSNIWLAAGSYAANYQTTPVPYGPTGGDTGNYQVVTMPSLMDGNWWRTPSVYNDGGIWQP